MTRRLLPLITVVFALAGGMALAPPAVAATDTATAAPDFASEVFADPWDYSNPDDMLLDGGGPTLNLQGAAIRDGRLVFGMTEPGYVSPLWGGYPGALYLGREGGAPQNRIDAGRFTRFSLHAYASQDTPAGLMWWTCEGLNGACQGGQPFQLRAGWHTYDFDVVNNGFGLPQAWTGSVTGLRLAISPSNATHFEFDWMRVYAPSGAAQVNANGSTWDVDDDPSDNHAGAPGWGDVSCTGSCDLSFLPPGRYTVGGDEVVLRRAPRPVILDPDVVGGLDYAGAAGDPWNFNGPADVARTGNATILGYGDKLTAVNAAQPHINDPFVWLRLPSGSIDTNRFHRLSVTSSYEGPFNLDDTAGGGTHGRVVWQRADQPAETVVQTKEWVNYTGTSRQTYDLKAPGIHEDDAPNKLPWETSAVTGLRWDPNEDHGPRRWTLDRVALRADDEAGSSFNIRWYDAGFDPSSTISLFYDTDAAGFDGSPIVSGLGQTAGTNGHVWNTSAVPAGTYHVYAVVDGPAGSGRAYSTGPVRVDHGIAGQSPSPASPLSRDLGDACPQSRVPSSAFPDVPNTVHKASIDCVAWWGVTRGNSSGGFSPDSTVTRGQMASFLAAVIEKTGGELPSSPPDAFSDDDGTTHELRINQLAALGVVKGGGDGNYRPSAPVTRDQMASFLSRAYTEAAGVELPSPADYFADDAGSTHEPNINRVAGAGIAGGVGEDRYNPAGGVRRAQMASFLARTLDVLVAGGYGAPPTR